MTVAVPRHLDEARALMALPAQRRVASLLEGSYAALHRGRSAEFNDLREYVRGDDPKDLDWKASARSRTLLVRRYDALRKLDILLVVSTARSMAAVSATGSVKRDVAIRVAGLLGVLAHRNGDPVALVRGDRTTRHFTPGRSGAGHLERCLNDVWTATSPAAEESDVAALLREVARVARKRRFVVVVSDEPVAGPELTGALRRLRAQHEVLVVLVEGMMATEVPSVGGPSVRDVGLLGGLPGWLRSDAELVGQADKLRRAQRDEIDAAFERLRIAHCRVSGVDEVVGALRDLFERHRRVGRRG